MKNSSRLKGAVFVFLIICLFGLPAQGALYSGGGTEADPYIIDTAAEMNDIGNNPNDFGSYFLLTADIDLGAYTGTSFNIIGNGSTKFTGVFDGNGHTISNFTYDSKWINYIGLFGYVDAPNAKIKNLGLIDPNVDAGTGDNVGSLVGRMEYGTISGCYVEGGSVSGDYEVGGLVGYNRDLSKVSNSYATASVSGKDSVGGLVGSNHGTVSNSYSAGDVNGVTNVGGLVGWDNWGNYTKSFWDNTVNPDVNGIGNTTDPNVIGESTANMQDQNTFLNAGWDFVGETNNGPSDFWAEPNNTGYMILWWQLSPLPALPIFSGGSGEANNPYLISTASQLNSIGHNPRLMGACFKLINDIDLTGVSFFIIANKTYPLKGVFDGNGHTISNFTYSSTGTNYIGLFGYVDDPNAEIKNLGLIDPNVNAGTGDNVGSLAGALWNGSITNCNSTASVSGNYYVGGLVGYNYNGTVSSSYSAGDVNGVTDVGGLMGMNYGTVSNSYATGSVSGNFVGGLVGTNGGVVNNSYATGSISGGERVGGLVGYNMQSAVISKCYSYGRVSGAAYVGWLVGYDNFGNYTKSFWDNTVNPDVNGIGNITDPNVIGESTANMQTVSTFIDAGWDFVDEIDNGVQNIWRLCSEGAEYPQLNWQFLLGDFGCPDGVEMNDLAVLVEQWLLEKLSADVAPDGSDGFVDFLDWAVFADGWQSTTDINDLVVFVEQWLRVGATSADIAPDGGDGIVNLPDFAALADNWLMGLGN